jgi:beta-glucosidase-like glycosyl hydrolase
MTLYKNERETLPLSDAKVKTVALIGPQVRKTPSWPGNWANVSLF